MRRTALLIAGMLLAAGTGLSAASPASAAVSGAGGDSSRWHCHWGNGHFWHDWDWDDGDHRRHDGDHRRRHCHNHRGHGHGGHGHWHRGHVTIGINLGGGGHH